jgi:ATPase family associated with various cellular activities (AAA)
VTSPRNGRAHDTAQQCARILAEVEQIIVGKRDPVTLVLLGILASGHILIEDLPGLGKTLLARTFADALGLQFTTAQASWTVRPAVWGRRSIGPVRVTCRGPGGTWSTAAQAWAGPIDVFPGRRRSGPGWSRPSCSAASVSTPAGPWARGSSSPASARTCPATGSRTSTGRSPAGAASCTSTSGPRSGRLTWSS